MSRPVRSVRRSRRLWVVVPLVVGALALGFASAGFGLSQRQSLGLLAIYVCATIPAVLVVVNERRDR
jgi:hypothetical protein